VGDGIDAAATIVGVVDDVITNPADGAARPTVLLPLAQRPPQTAVVGVRTVGGSDLLSQLNAAIGRVRGDIPLFSVEMLEAARAASIGPQWLAVLLLALFGATAMVLSAIGIYAVVAQSVQERGREIAIRMTFGAEPRQVFLNELARGGYTVAISSVVGAAVALLSVTMLSAAGFQSVSWQPIGISTGLVAALALAATAIPAHRATRSNAQPLVR
jgi:putative ABC transport system permease protein